MAVAAILCPGVVTAQKLETFLEPAHMVDISAPFRDRIERVLVHENDHVSKGALLAELDCRVLKSRLQVARQTASFHGEIDAANALVQLRRNRVHLLEKLEKSGNVRPQELATARAELEMAFAKLQSAKEHQKLKRLEIAVIEAQISEKQLVSPIDGVIIQINKEEAELLGGSDPEPLMTIAQLDPLHAVFHISPELVSILQKRKSIPVQVGNKNVNTTLDFISPIIDARSGTVTVRLIVPNPNHTLKSGSRCVLALESFPEGDLTNDRTENPADKSQVH